MQEIFLKIRYFERDYQKVLKKFNLVFLSNPVPFNGQSYQKQKGPGLVTSRFQVTKQVQKNPFIISYILSDQV